MQQTEHGHYPRVWSVQIVTMLGENEENEEKELTFMWN